MEERKKKAVEAYLAILEQKIVNLQISELTEAHRL